MIDTKRLGGEFIGFSDGKMDMNILFANAFWFMTGFGISVLLKVFNVIKKKDKQINQPEKIKVVKE